MDTHFVKAAHISGMSFSASINGHEVAMDNPENGEPSIGPSPKRLMLAALAGCTGVEVVSILNKMKVPFEGLEISVEAGLTENHPKLYQNVKIMYSIKLADANKPKMAKAVNLSMDKYCGVSAMFRGFAKLDTEILFL